MFPAAVTRTETPTMCPLPVSPPPRYFSVSLTTSRSHSEVILSLWESFFLFSGDLTISLSEGRSGVVVGQFIYTPGREIQRACSRENVCMPQRTEQQPGAESDTNLKNGSRQRGDCGAGSRALTDRQVIIVELVKPQGQWGTLLLPSLCYGWRVLSKGESDS